MPSSSPALLTPIVNLVRQFDPLSVLDVGCGLGKWGVLCREYLDWWRLGSMGERRTRIDAVEIHAPYIRALHHAVYDNIWFPVDALNLLHLPPETYNPRPPDTWDLILSVDMIEHLDRERGQFFIDAAMRRCRTLLVSTPMMPSEQGPMYGNEHERHVSKWKPADFEGEGRAVSGIATAGFWIVTVTRRDA